MRFLEWLNGPSEPRIQWLGDLHRIDVRPGDVFVLKAQRRLTKEQRDMLREQWSAQMPADCKCLVIDEAMEIGVFGKVQP